MSNEEIIKILAKINGDKLKFSERLAITKAIEIIKSRL